MKKYELLLVLPGTLDEPEAEVKAEEILSLVKGVSADADIHTLGKNRLAYPVKQIRYGYFYTIIFTAEPVGLKTLQDKLALLREPLRTMITYFNTSLTAAQKIVYSTDDTGVTTMREKEKSITPNFAPVNAPVMAEVSTAKVAAPPAPSAVERKLDKLDMEEISKKLDDIMGGDIAPDV